MGLLRQAMRSQRLGVPVTISAEQTALHGLSLARDAWRAQATESPVGAMTAIGVHLVDGMIDLMGPVAVGLRHRLPPSGAVQLMIRPMCCCGSPTAPPGTSSAPTAATPNYRMAVYGTGDSRRSWATPMDTFRLVPAGGESGRRR